MAEEETNCIQDRLRSVASRSKEMFSSWPVISLILIFLLFIVALPEILTHLFGRKTLIPILSVLGLESRFEVLFGLSVALFTAMQYKVSKSLLKIEQQRNPPIIVAEISGRSPWISIENKGGGIAWGCEINFVRLDLDGAFEELIEKLHPWSGEQFNIPEEWCTGTFDLFIGITYYTEEDMRLDSYKEWMRIFKKFGPIYDF